MVKRVAEKPNFAAGAQVAGVDIDLTLITELQSAVALQSAQIQAKLQADAGYSVSNGMVPSANATVVGTISRANAASTFDKTAHTLNIGDTFKFTALGNTTGVSVGVIYYVAATGFTANAFRAALTSGGAALSLAGAVDTNTISITKVGLLDVSAGTEFVGTTEKNVAAVTGSSVVGPVAALADATNPKWVLIEETNAGALAVTQGTAAASPAIPTIPSISTNVPIALYSIPAAAQEIDTLLTTVNGKAKLIDIRNPLPRKNKRVIYSDPGKGSVSLANSTALTTLVNAVGSIPADSLNVGDILEFTISGLSFNTTNGFSEVQVFVGASSIMTYTLTVSPGGGNVAGFHWFTIKFTAYITAIGGSGTMSIGGLAAFSPNGSQVFTADEISSITKTGEGFIIGASGIAIATNGALAIDFKYKFVTSPGSPASALIYNMVVEKTSVV